MSVKQCRVWDTLGSYMLRGSGNESIDPNYVSRIWGAGSRQWEPSVFAIHRTSEFGLVFLVQCGKRLLHRAFNKRFCPINTGMQCHTDPNSLLVRWKYWATVDARFCVESWPHVIKASRLVRWERLPGCGDPYRRAGPKLSWTDLGDCRQCRN